MQDLGLLFQPNLETLYALKPDTIVITPQHALLKPALAQVAPLVTLPAHGLSAFISATQQLGIVLKREPQAAALIAGLSQRIIRARRLCARNCFQPVLFASPGWMRYTCGCIPPVSLPGDVLAACGMRNAWRASGGAEGNVLVELTVSPPSMPDRSCWSRRISVRR
ncbi:iron-hydroxamate transporter substrate-binding subunit [Raoultella planticola]|uniref:Iron-hydroxamate transporter substrate-binding subunit n=1 Tax=Raoultella planticola TaxID=575 RepID=A0A485BVK0_RAOPL|nr:iron-hydroxamate transporter substrate-binding subunit [Raoultella planticola]